MQLLKIIRITLITIIRNRKIIECDTNMILMFYLLTTFVHN